MTVRQEELMADAVRFIAGSLGHEINNHLTVILGNAQVAKRKYAGDNSFVRIEESANQISGSISSLTNLASRFGGARKKVDLVEALRDIQGDLEATFGERLKVDLPEEDPCHVRMDAGRLFLALYFAVDALDDGVTLTLNKISSEEVAIVLEGKGPKLTEDMTTLASSTSPEILIGESSLEVGLSMTKAFSHRCQGSLEVTSQKEAAKIVIRMTILRDIKSFLDELE